MSGKKEIMPLKKSGIKTDATAKVAKKVEHDKSVIGTTKPKKGSLPFNHKAAKK